MNASRETYGFDPFCHMVVTEVSTSFDLPCFPRRKSMRPSIDRVVITIRDLPSKTKCLRFKEVADRAARRAAKGFTRGGGGEVAEEVLVATWIIRLLEFRQTAA